MQTGLCGNIIKMQTLNLLVALNDLPRRDRYPSGTGGSRLLSHKSGTQVQYSTSTIPNPVRTVYTPPSMSYRGVPSSRRSARMLFAVMPAAHGLIAVSFGRVCVCVCVCVSVSECLFFFDRKMSRTALLFLRSFLSTAFLASFLSRGSQRVCVCVCVLGGCCGVAVLLFCHAIVPVAELKRASAFDLPSRYSVVQGAELSCGNEVILSSPPPPHEGQPQVVGAGFNRRRLTLNPRRLAISRR